MLLHCGCSQVFTKMAEQRVYQSNVLMIRHLPSSLDVDDKEEFLKHFGAVSVKCMADRGRMKHTAFATFSDHKDAKQALHRLHQLDVLGHTLIAEFARTRRQVDLAKSSLSSRLQQDQCSHEGSKKTEEEPDSESMGEMYRREVMKSLGMAANLGIAHPINPQLRYHYPPPTVTILSNIVNALASVPKFYVQTLHLMNKMNLPAPFGPLTPAPPLEDDRRVLPPEPEERIPAEMEVSSSSEGSEMESDEESRERARIHDQQLGHATVKRPRQEKKSGNLRKRPRLQDMIAAAAMKAAVKSDVDTDLPHQGKVVPPQAVFEPMTVAGSHGGVKKAEIRLAESITSSLERQIQHGQEQGPTCISRTETKPHGSPDVTDDGGGFGVFQPARAAPEVIRKDDEEEEDEDDEEDEGPESSEFITREQLKKRLSKEEMKHISAFKNYIPGDPTTRLYIKNLAKQVEEKDLKFVYGRYVDWASPMDRDMFNIQLMKQGRMKGQAFVGLPSELAAQKALKDTNGLLLNDKPIVVSFARSAKPKEEDPKKKKGAAKGDNIKKQREGRRI